MEKFKQYFKENAENYKYIMAIIMIISCIVILYSIIAGIWRFVPVEKFNLKMFCSGIVTGIVGLILFFVFDDLK